MKLFSSIALAASMLAIAPALKAAPEGWSEDLEMAIQQAKEQKKDILIDFTGSDWCGWCIKLDKEVFGTPFFKEKAKEKFILVYIDFPRNKQLITPEQQNKNEKLMQKYGVRGFPTILLLDSDGNKYAETGYQAGGPEKYMEHLAQFAKNKTAREEFRKAVEKANGLQGAEKAKALDAALKLLSEEDRRLENKIFQQIVDSDPKNETGLLNTYYVYVVIDPMRVQVEEEVQKRYTKEIEEMNKRFSELRKSGKNPNSDSKFTEDATALRNKFQQDTSKEMIKRLTALNEKYQFQGYSKQIYLVYYAQSLLNMGENDKAIAMFKEALEADKTSSLAPNIELFLKNNQQMKPQGK